MNFFSKKKLDTLFSEQKHSKVIKKISELTIEEKSVTYFDVPEKYEDDAKNYRVIQLSNGLKALLVEDLSTTENSRNDSVDFKPTKNNKNSSIDPLQNQNLSAVCLMVNVGGFSDPSSINGLAHFLEHMIFMGSEEFPSTDDFLRYVEEHDGFLNASTQRQQTMFQFKIRKEFLEGALKRLSSFFISPLMNKNAIENERQLIENEFSMTLQNERWRKIHVFSALANPKHPISKFTCGNLKTLKENVDDETLYRKVSEFRERHYSAHRMYLCVQSRMSLDDIQKLVINHFAKIKNNELPEDDFSQFNYKNAFKEEFYTHVLCVKPAGNTNRISLTWCLPSIAQDYLCKPHHYISYLLTRKDKGSLFSYLRRKLWARDINTDLYDENSMLCIFELFIDLTEIGFSHLNDVLDATFSYIKFIEEFGLQETIYNELKQIVENNYRFRNEKDPYDNVQNLVMNLKYFPSKDILFGPELYYGYDTKSIMKIIKFITNERFNIMITSKQKYNSYEFNRKEKWYGVMYTIIEMPQKWKDLWKNRKTKIEFLLPEKNNFISRNFQILSKSLEKRSGYDDDDYEYDDDSDTGTIMIDEIIGAAAAACCIKPPKKLPPYPRKICENDIYELWFKEDLKFHKPRAFVYIYLISPLPLESPTNTVLLTMYGMFVNFVFKEKLFLAVTAGYEYSLYNDKRGYLLQVQGYNEKIHLVIDEMTKIIATIESYFNEAGFKSFVKKLKEYYNNSLINTEIVSNEIRREIIHHIQWSTYHLSNALDKINFNHLRAFATGILKELRIRALMQGNMTEGNAKSIMETIIKNIACNKIENILKTEVRIHQLPRSSNYFICRSFKENNPSTTVMNFYQIGPNTIRKSCLIEWFAAMIQQPLIDMLYTKEKLGNHIWCTPINDNGIIGYQIGVNAITDNGKANTVAIIEDKIEAFRVQSFKLLKRIDEKQYEKVKEMLIRQKSMTINDIKDEVQSYWHEILIDDYLFDRNQYEINCLRTLKKGDILAFLDSYEKQGIRKLSIQVIGCKVFGASTIFTSRQLSSTLSLKKISTSKATISKISDFKKNLNIFPIIITDVNN